MIGQVTGVEQARGVSRLDRSLRYRLRWEAV